MLEKDLELLKDIYDSAGHCNSFSTNPELLDTLRKLAASGLLIYTEKIESIGEMGVTTASLTEKGIDYIAKKFNL